jgi:hypothetical protein
MMGGEDMYTAVWAPSRSFAPFRWQFRWHSYTRARCPPIIHIPRNDAPKVIARIGGMSPLAATQAKVVDAGRQVAVAQFRLTSSPAAAVAVVR